MINYVRETHSCDETETAGFEAARLCKENNIGFIAMYGDLGAGKTAFVRGAAKALSPGAAVTSPTYSIVNAYAPSGFVKPTLFHFDMYRIESEDDLDSIDFDSYFVPDALIITEWSENIEFALPESYVRVDIEKLGETDRRITVKEIKKE